MSARIYTDDPFFKLVGMSIFTTKELKDFCKTHLQNVSFNPYITIHPDGRLCTKDELYDRVFRDDSSIIGSSYDEYLGTMGVGGGNSVNLIRWDKESKTFIETDASYYLNMKTDFHASTLDQYKIPEIIYCHENYLRQKYRDKSDPLQYFKTDFGPGETHYHRGGEVLYGSSLLGTSHAGTYTYEDAEEMFFDINKSASGCVEWRPTLYLVINKKENCIRRFNPRLRLALGDEKKHREANIAASPIPYFSAPPRTIVGTTYGKKTTTDKKLDLDYHESAIVPTTEDKEKDPENHVAGLLDMTYNENTKMWEAGTRNVLAYLLQDIEGVSAPGYDPETIDDITVEETYYPDGDHNQNGDFDEEKHTGWAVPVIPKKGIKHLYGANVVGTHRAKDDPDIKLNRKEKILITNRTPRNFVKNQKIMCSYIAGEWIPQDLGQDSFSPQFKITNWAFQKYIVDSDSYFKDTRHYDEYNEVNDYYHAPLDSESYEQNTRNKFYVHLQASSSPPGQIPAPRLPPQGSLVHDQGVNSFKTIAALNILPEIDLEPTEAVTAAFVVTGVKENYDILPSNRYMQITAFDQMGDFAGGKNKKNILARTNLYSPPTNSPDGEDPSSLNWLEFWGPSFSNGYNSVEVQTLLSKKNTLKIGGAGSSYNEWVSDYDSTINLPAIDDTVDNRNLSRNYPGGMFGNLTDKKALNLPAEVAMNCSPFEDGLCSPIEDTRRMSLLFADKRLNFVDSVKDVLQSDIIVIEKDFNHPSDFVEVEEPVQDRFKWLYEIDQDDQYKGVKSSLYNLKPNSPQKITFFALSAEVVSSTDYDTTNNPPTANPNDLTQIEKFGNVDLMKEHLRGKVYIDGDTKHMLGGDWIFERHLNTNQFIQKTNVLVRDPVGELNRIDYGYFNQTILHTNSTYQGPNGVPSYKIPYYDYVKEESPDGNSGGVNTIWIDDKANCVGVIASKCTISFKGTKLLFMANQQFGLQGKTTISLSATPELNIIGGFLAAQVGGNSGPVVESPRWGQPSDRPSSFHTTALHVKMFDAWPREQTIHDGRYFAVMHFNPGKLLSPAKKGDDVITNTAWPLKEWVGKPDIIPEEETVDFRIPTTYNNNVIAVGKEIRNPETLVGDNIVYSNNEDLWWAPEEYWRVNTIRRGMMLNNGGFKYIRRVCGIGGVQPNYMKFVTYGNNPLGDGYDKDDILTTSGGSGKNVQVKVGETNNGKIILDNLEIISRGEGFLPEDFEALGGYSVGDPEVNRSKVKLKGGSGTGAEIYISEGVIHDELMEYDDYPRNRSDGSILITDGNNRGGGNTGEGPVEGFKEQSLVLTEPNKSGKYDLFFHFHNDISHTIHSTNGMVSKPQRVELEITAI